MQEAKSLPVFSEWLKNIDPLGSFGKIPPVYCHLTEEEILVPSSGRWLNSGMGLPIEFWTLNTLESPNDAVESTLSDILVGENVPQKYYFSPVACMGLLRRHAERQKPLPSVLLRALEEGSTRKPKLS